MAETDSYNDQQRESSSLTPRHSRLSIEAGDSSAAPAVPDDDNNTDDQDGDNVVTAAPPLDQRILEIVHRNRTIRPGLLAAELGLSVEDASAELCGLLAAVGGGPDGATFRFEAIQPKEQDGSTSTSGMKSVTMVFTFPPDFEKRARRQRRREDLGEAAYKMLRLAVKVLKIVTAFGLILSLLILSAAALMALVAAMVALSRGDSQGGGHRHARGALLRQMRLIFYSVRQMLWCYALFGPTGDNTEDSEGRGPQQQDPFLREVAYDLWLILAVCCGNPGSIFYWMRASQLQRRRRRLFRGWAGRGGQGSNNTISSESDIPGVTLIQRGEHSPNTSNAIINGGASHQGLLSVAVEFLFGPTPFAAGPTEAEKWVLRSAALMQLSTKSQPSGSGVSLEEMAPYTDSPPTSLEDTSKIVEQTLLIVSHFNGLPSNQQEQQQASEEGDGDARKAKFIFPEIMAESAVVSRYEYTKVEDDGTWQSLLFRKQEAATPRRANALPLYLKEERFRFSNLTSQQLMHCLVLGSLNLIGVIWLQQSVLPGGLLHVTAPTNKNAAVWLQLQKIIIPLKFYALLFFALPTGRLLLIVFLNHLRQKRNQRRANLVARTLGSYS